jgi:hypothetical protein
LNVLARSARSTLHVARVRRNRQRHPSRGPCTAQAISLFIAPGRWKRERHPGKEGDPLRLIDNWVCRKDAERGHNQEFSKLLVSPSNWLASHSTTQPVVETRYVELGPWHGGVLQWRTDQRPRSRVTVTERPGGLGWVEPMVGRLTPYVDEVSDHTNTS